MSRVALMPARGDPFCLMLALEFFAKVWFDDVDALDILVNSPIEAEVVDFLEDRLSDLPKINFQHQAKAIEHGGALKQLFDQTVEDTVVFLEDDCFILKRGVVRNYCEMVERGVEWDMVGSGRNMCDPGLEQAMKQRFKAERVGFWPCFFFARRRDILRTDCHFGAKNFPPGVLIPELDYTPETLQCSDTFTWFSIQMRALGMRGLEVEQFRGDENLGAEGCPWMHTGAPSGLIEMELKDERGVPLIRRKVPGAVPPDDPELHGTPYEIERRLSWATLCVDRFWKEAEPITEFRDLYKSAISRYATRFGLDMGRIKSNADRYSNILEALTQTA